MCYSGATKGDDIPADGGLQGDQQIGQVGAVATTHSELGTLFFAGANCFASLILLLGFCPMPICNGG